jgi:RNA polymerase sigma factor (sigma-70 family)
MLSYQYRPMDQELDPPDSANSLPDPRARYWSDCLLQVAQTQDQRAFRELFEHFAPMVKAFAFKIPSLEQSEQFAEDLLQETMIKVWNKANSFDPKLASPSTWIFTIARNMRIDLLRKQARHVVNAVALYGDDEDGDIDLEDIWFEDESSDVFNVLAQQRTRKQIHDSMKTLPSEQALVLAKVYLEDRSHADVAEELQLPLGTVKSRVRLALSKLKVIVDR